MKRKQQRLLARLCNRLEERARGRHLHCYNIEAHLSTLDPAMTLSGYISPLSQIIYRGPDGVRVCLGLTNEETTYLLGEFPISTEVFLFRARQLLKTQGFGRYRRFFAGIRARLWATL